MKRIETRRLKRNATDMGPGEGDRGGDSGEEDVPHVSGRTSVRLNKESVEQQGNAAERQNKGRQGRGEEGGGGGGGWGRLMRDGCSPLSLHTIPINQMITVQTPHQSASSRPCR